MKINITESQYDTFLELIPENTAEMALLLRMVKNSLSEKPDMYFSFSEFIAFPYAGIAFKRKQPSNRLNAIR